MSRFDPFKARLAVSKLNSIRVWPYSVHGIVRKGRVILKTIMKSLIIEHTMTCMVLGNTVVLMLGYYGAS